MIRHRIEGAAERVFPFLGYVLLQAFAVAGIPPGRWHDTPTYEHLSLTGAAVRLPTVPLFYTLLSNDTLRLWGQVALAAVAWWVLARVASAQLVGRGPRLSLRIVLLLLGLTAPIVSWNSTMLSESIAISLTALLVAAFIELDRRRTTPSALSALAALAGWTFTRQSNVLMTLLIAVVCIAAAGCMSRGRRALVITAAGAVVVAVLGLAAIHQNQTVAQANTGAIIQNRLLGNRGWRAWLIAHGMPYSSSIGRRVGTPFHYDASGADGAWFAWIREHGQSTYTAFVVHHPRYALILPLPYLLGEEPSSTRLGLSPLQPDPTPSMLSPSVDYGRHRNVLPSAVDSLLFDQGRGVALVILAGVAFGLAWSARRRTGRDHRVVVPTLVAVSALPQAYIAWLGGGDVGQELDRLSMLTAVSARIGLWIVFFVSVDRLLAHERVTVSSSRQAVRAQLRSTIGRQG